MPFEILKDDSQLLFEAYLSSEHGAAAARSGMFLNTGMLKENTWSSPSPAFVYAFFIEDASDVGAFTFDIY